MEIFRFSEEDRREAALLAMPKEALLRMLADYRADLPCIEREAVVTRAVQILERMAEETDRALREMREKIGLFGQTDGGDAVYRIHCALQVTLQDGTKRLSALVCDGMRAIRFRAEPYADWTVKRLSQGLIADETVIGAAKQVLIDRECALEAARRMGEALELLRRFASETYAEYAARVTEVADAKHRGRGMDPVRLSALGGELAAAARACVARIAG